MATDAATLISRINSDIAKPEPVALFAILGGEPEPHAVTSEYLKRKNELQLKLLDHLEKFATQEKGIWADRSLSDTGKTALRLKLAEASLTQLVWLGRLLKDLGEAQARMRTLLFVVQPSVTDEVLRQMRAREIRDTMRGLNQNERDAQYIKASERDQTEVLWTMLNGPEGNWITPEIQQRADIQRAERVQPEQFHRFEQNVIFHDYVRSLADHLRHMLVSYGVLPETARSGMGLAA
jgi:hypothetical protein